MDCLVLYNGPMRNVIQWIKGGNHPTNQKSRIKTNLSLRDHLFFLLLFCEARVRVRVRVGVRVRLRLRVIIRVRFRCLEIVIDCM